MKRSYMRAKEINSVRTHLQVEFRIWRQAMGWKGDNGHPWWYAELRAAQASEQDRWHGPFATKKEAIRVAYREIEKTEKGTL